MGLKSYNQHALSRKLTLYIVLVSSLVTFFAIGFLLYRQYESDIDKLEQRLNSIKLSTLPTLSSSLWEFNEQQVQTIADSLMNLDDVVLVEVKTYTWDGKGKIIKARHAKPLTKNILTSEFPIERMEDGEIFDLGTLTIVTTLDNVRKNLWQQAVYIFITQGIKTFIITSLILLLLRYLLVRHLKQIYQYTRKLNLNNGHNPLVLDRKQNAQGDELDQVVDTINEMHLSLIEEQQRELELQKQKAFAEARAQAKSDFLTHMSHEIRTPLNGIVGLLDLLDEDNLNEKQKTYLQTIQTSSQSLIQIINDILDLSKIEASKLSLRQETFSISHLIRECTNLYTASAKEKNIHITEDIDASLKHKFVGDPLRIKQILLNLLSNAIKFTEEGEIIIKVERDQLTNPKQKIHSLIKFSVIDTGMGIVDNNKTRIFEAFEHENNTSQGTGLGLSICKNLCTLMGGDIGLNSRLNEGSEFWFSLPLQETKVNHQKAADQYIEPRSETLDFSKLEKAGVLVVEDNEVNQKVIKSLLNKLSIKPEIVNNGQEACDFKNKHANSYLVILMDCEMPVMDGFDASKYIRQQENEQQLTNSIIISLSAYSDQSYYRKCMEAGMDYLLNKPVTLKELEAMLDKAQKKLDENGYNHA